MVRYEKRLRCSIYGIPNYPIFTESGLQIATGYQRIVINKKGLRVEFLEDQLIPNSYYLDPNEDARLDNPRYCYVKYRTDDICNLTIYHLRREVSYSNPGIAERYYIAPFHLYDRWGNVLIIPPLQRATSRVLYKNIHNLNGTRAAGSKSREPN